MVIKSDYNKTENDGNDNKTDNDDDTENDNKGKTNDKGKTDNNILITKLDQEINDNKDYTINKIDVDETKTLDNFYNDASDMLINKGSVITKNNNSYSLFDDAKNY